MLGTPEGDWVSMAVPSDGSYGVGEGIISGFPCTCAGGEYEIVEGLEIDDFSRERIDASVAELREERDAVSGARPDLRRRKDRVGRKTLAVRLGTHPGPCVALAPSGQVEAGRRQPVG